MILPDVLNTILLGLIFMVVLVTVVRPLVLNVVGNPIYTDAEQRAMLEAIYDEVARRSYEEEAKRANQIRYQQLLIELPPRLQPKPVPEPEPEVDATQEAAFDDGQAAGTDAAGEPPEGADVAATTNADGQDPAAESETAVEGELSDQELAQGEIEIREGESLAEIKERMKRERQSAKKPSIPPELLNNAKSYEDKVGVVRMVVQQDQSRVAAVIRGMIETK
jgi:hypothetical protein